MDRYQPIEKLGEGAFGEVWLEFDVVSRKHVAVKRLTKLDDDSLRRFEREARILAEARECPHIVRILDFDNTSWPPRLVMDYYPERSLERHIGGGLPPTAVLVIAKQISAALVYLHARGGFHRDVKARNILVERLDRVAWRVRLGDFGLGQDPGATSEVTFGPGGTLTHMAPELFHGDPYSRSADIYSLGITMLEMLCGKPDSRLLDGLQVPVQLKRLISSMLAEDKTKRPAAAGIIAWIDEYFQKARETAVVRRPAPQAAPAVDWAGLLVSGLVVAGLAGLLAALFGGDE